MQSINSQSSKEMRSSYTPQELEVFAVQIEQLLQQQDAIITAHYYVDSALQYLAEKTGGMVGDSLEMARFSSAHKSSCTVVCGVEFMAETAKIISPHKRIISLDREATCSLDIGCPIDKFSAFCDSHPERSVVVYANTSAAVKARADWVVTSSIALDVVEYLDSKNTPIIWAPDKHLGRYIQKKTEADMLLWNGSCIVHEEFQHTLMQQAKVLYPNAKVLAHPESPIALLNLADFVGSTSQIIAQAKNSEDKQFIVATEQGIFYKLKQVCPDKEFITAPTAGQGATCQSCSRCPWMAMGTVEKLVSCFDSKSLEIVLEKDVIQSAQISLNRMLDFSEKITV